jgi:hypothetical protein
MAQKTKSGNYISHGAVHKTITPSSESGTSLVFFLWFICFINKGSLLAFDGAVSPLAIA